MNISQSQPVLICGAGISGLALGQGLLKARIPFRIFERDPIFNVRAQGYRVRINGVGISALTQILSPELLSRLKASCAHIAYDSKEKRMLGASFDALTGKVHQRPGGLQPPAQDVEPLNADRTALRDVLIRGLEEYVEFGKEFTAYELTPEGVTVRFADGSEVRGAILVGADGSRSRIKKQFLPGQVLLDTEGRWIYGKTPLTPELEKTFETKALKTMTGVHNEVADVPQTLLLEPIRFKDNEFRHELPDDYIYWVLASRKDTLDMDDEKLLHLSNEETAELSRKLTAHWAPSFHALFDLQAKDKSSMLRIASADPKIPVWEPSNRITLIGDAIHLMSPTAGVGATSALRDAVALTNLLEEKGLSAESIGEYEASMRIYAGEAIMRSRFIGEKLFGMRALDELKHV